MISLQVSQLERITEGVLFSCSDKETLFTGVTIDSRNVQGGELFVAVKGDNNDGHNYIDQAINNNVSAVVAEKSFSNWNQNRKNIPIVAVENSHEALLKIAEFYRNTLSATFIGITGSNGKTTTKEFAFSLFNLVEENSFRSPGNFNNLFGAPLSIFKIQFDTKIAIMEIGISTSTEMPKLTQLIKPDIILITNVGPSHLEYLSTVKEVALAKLEIVKNSSNDIPLLINGDDEILVEQTQKIRKDFYTFGFNNDNNLTPENIKQNNDGTTNVTIDNIEFKLPFGGTYQIMNLMAAYSVFITAGYTITQEQANKLNLCSAPMRGQLEEYAGVKFMVDCYNANPDSVKAGLKAFSQIKTNRRRVLILGDMLELGKDSEKYHREIGRIINQYSFGFIILIGHEVKNIPDEIIDIETIYFKDVTVASKEIRNLLTQNDFAYIKGSRSVGLEQILKQFKNNEGDI
ncbi:MAG: UDP-N-acetylmuramoyl-tripeptide--D-alanyl-D-alanine ligase [candidate division Zixibacteria bacterium]|nr:UDP-N-acetylmuramoyl-tripeptide--D-alanyl-D-alanine ligase [candidate division Zixibacteria bacterium]